MLQTEIDEISEAFSDAWQEYFGQPMFYVPFLESQTPKNIYNESKDKKYDFDNKVPFFGTYKQEPIEEKGEMGGRVEEQFAEVTFVTKELFDKGVTEIDSRALIEITHRSGKTHLYNIIEHYGKVQLGDNKVFYKLKVKDLQE